MSSEVDWVLDQLASVVSSQPAEHPLKRVDRDDSQVYEGSQTVDMSTPIHTRVGELKTANFVGAALADVSNSPIGTEYDYDREAVVGVRIEGVHHTEWGHVDPTGSEGVVWSDLVDAIRDAILAQREFPDAGASNVSYTHLQTANEAPQSDNYADYYRHDFDVIFHGYEDLP